MSEGALIYKKEHLNKLRIHHPCLIPLPQVVVNGSTSMNDEHRAHTGTKSK